MRIILIALLACLPLSVAAVTPDEPLTPYQWAQAQKVAFDKSEQVYADALKRNGLLAQFRTMRDAYRADSNKAFRIVFGQYLSWYQTFVGDYIGAHESYSIRQLPASDDASSPLAVGEQPKSALDAIAALAKDRKAVFFNEAHNVPITRTLTVELLPRLRKEGFTYFAAETLYQADADALQKRGYPIPASGFYTMEPIAAEMVRTALKLGFKVVAYESEKPGNGDIREHAQAQNLYDRVFKHDPAARLVVNAGYAHIQENGRYLGGRSMAQHFRKISDIEPLTIEQTMLINHPAASENHPYYQAVMAVLHPTEPLVFEDKDGNPWSLKPKAYDVSVFFPPDIVRDDRPTWLSLGGLRSAYFVSGALCKDDFPCLIEARYANEGDDAIPADSLVLDPVKHAQNKEERLFQGKPDAHGSLYLRPGAYRLSGVDADNHLLFRQPINVRADAPNSAASGASKEPDSARKPVCGAADLLTNGHAPVPCAKDEAG